MNKKVFFIAEAGVNHNGDINLAYQLIDVAKEAGADAVKFQTFKSENVTTRHGKMAEYQKINLGKEESQIEMIRKFELKFEDFGMLKQYCEEIGIMFLSTPHSGKDSIDYLESIGVQYYKFGSGDITNIPALKHAARYNRPMILGTGMCYLNDIELAVKSIKDECNNTITLLHCTTNYPCPLDQVNLGAMLTMKEKFSNEIIGYSDHTVGWKVPLLSAFLGAEVIEKHFTLDKNMEGPDHVASSSPEELKDIIKRIRDFENDRYSKEELIKLIGEEDYVKIMGSFEKKPNDIELKNILVARKSIVSTKALKKGTVISEEDIAIKRPGGGLEPKFYYDLIGKVINKDLDEDEQIFLDDIH